MAGAMHPPFSLFLPEENEKTGRARSKREKEVGTRRTGARLNDWLKPGMTSPHAIGLSGGLSVIERTSCCFRCRSQAIESVRRRQPGRFYYRPATAEREIRQVENHQLPFDCAAGKSFLASASHSGAPPRPSSRTSFSLLDRARPVFSFSSGRKRENGGCKGPAIFMAVSLNRH